MNPIEWKLRCSARLHAQWPSLTREQRDEVADELWSEPRWRALEPETAVAEWLRPVLPARSRPAHAG